MRRLVFRGLLCLLLMLMAFAAGVRWRQIAISGGTHTFIEAEIGGRWETFDATVNEWMDRSAFEMERGAARSYRAFWSPMDDARATDRYQPGMQAAVQDLRIAMRGLGLYWWPKAYLFVAEESS